MTRAAPTKLSIKKDFRFWTFHEMFMNHIKDIDWIKSPVFTKSATDYNIAKDFGQVRLDTIQTDYQALEISTLPTDNIKKLKFRGLYTWLLKSSNESDQDFFAKESDNNHQSGPLAWKLLTTNILCGIKQGICLVKNMIHKISLEKFDNNIKSLVKALKENCKLPASWREIESSIIAIFLRVVKKSPSSEFNSYIRRFQENMTTSQILIQTNSCAKYS